MSRESGRGLGMVPGTCAKSTGVAVHDTEEGGAFLLVATGILAGGKKHYVCFTTCGKNRVGNRFHARVMGIGGDFIARKVQFHCFVSTKIKCITQYHKVSRSITKYHKVSQSYQTTKKVVIRLGYGVILMIRDTESDTA